MATRRSNAGGQDIAQGPCPSGWEQAEARSAACLIKKWQCDAFDSAASGANSRTIAAAGTGPNRQPGSLRIPRFAGTEVLLNCLAGCVVDSSVGACTCRRAGFHPGIKPEGMLRRDMRLARLWRAASAIHAHASPPPGYSHAGRGSIGFTGGRAARPRRNDLRRAVRRGHRQTRR
jgi:hypothetical protein